MTNANTGEGQPPFDLHISHAPEDKEAVAQPLAEALLARGLKVSLDESEFRIGDFFVQRINDRITNSRSAVIVVSRHYFDNIWTRYELNALLQLAYSSGRRLFPVWHDIDAGEVRNRSVFLASLVGRRTGEDTYAEIAEEIARAEETASQQS